MKITATVNRVSAKELETLLEGQTNSLSMAFFKHITSIRATRFWVASALIWQEDGRACAISATDCESEEAAMRSLRKLINDKDLHVIPGWTRVYSRKLNRYRYGIFLGSWGGGTPAVPFFPCKGQLIWAGSSRIEADKALVRLKEKHQQRPVQLAEYFCPSWAGGGKIEQWESARVIPRSPMWRQLVEDELQLPGAAGPQFSREGTKYYLTSVTVGCQVVTYSGHGWQFSMEDFYANSPIPLWASRDGKVLIGYEPVPGQLFRNYKATREQMASCGLELAFDAAVAEMRPAGTKEA